MDNKVSLLNHLEELRIRIILCFLIILLSSGLSFCFIENILIFLTKPIGKLFFFKPAEAFFIRMELSFYSGLLISMPFIIYHIWQFVKPGLIELEKRLTMWIIPLSYSLFILGTAFAFFVLLPPCIKILLSYGSENINPMISVSSYVSFATTFSLSFGLIFQFPLIMLLLIKLKIIQNSWLIKNRKYAILIIFILAAVLTPGPDVFSQFMMAIPTLIIYELSILMSKIFFK